LRHSSRIQKTLSNSERQIRALPERNQGPPFLYPDFISVIPLLPKMFMSLDAALGKMRIPRAAQEIGKNAFGFGQRLHGRRLRRVNYAEGGARDAMCEETRETAGTESSGSGRLANGKSTATQWLVSGCAAT
jgi:hypothetical protein